MKTTIRFGVEVEDVTETQEYLPNIYSQAHQDLFALGMNDYKMNGTYVDIGCSMPRDCNNTYLLEKFGWTGLSIDIRAFEKMWEEHRTNKFLACDATKLDYRKLFEDTFEKKQIDYLSFDVDAASNEVLPLLPFDSYTFNVITIEHDMYNGDPKFKNLQHEVLKKHNYVLLAENVCVFEKHWVGIFEDWWVIPEMYEKYKGMVLNKQLNYTYSDEILNKLGLFLNREILIENAEKTFRIKDLSTPSNLKALATDYIDQNKLNINLSKKPRLIFIDGQHLMHFFSQILPYINYSFSIILNNDSPVSPEFTNIFNDSRIVNVFVKSGEIINSKINVIPNYRQDSTIESEQITNEEIIENLNFRKKLSEI